MPLAEPLDYERMEWVDEVMPHVTQAHTRSGTVEDLRRDYPVFKDRRPGPRIKGYKREYTKVLDTDERMRTFPIAQSLRFCSRHAAAEPTAT